MILAAVAALNKAMLPCLSLQNQFDPVQLFQPYYSISPRVSHYFWNVIAIACSYISNLGLEPACHVVWNNAFSFFKAKKKWNSLDLFVFFVHLFTCFTSASDVRLMEFMEVTPETLDQRCRYPESNDLGEILYGVDDVCHSNEASLDFTLWKNMS